MQTIPLPLEVDSVAAQQREALWSRASAYLAIFGVGGLLALYGFGSIANPFVVAAAALACIALAILIRPVYGVYLTVFFSVLGDGATMYNYPFNFNFSSTRSMLYLSDALTFSPLEICLLLTVVGWFLQRASARDWRLAGAPLLRPMLFFGVMVVFGFAWGMANGGDFTVAMWELRPLVYMVAMFVLASNLFTRAAQYVRLAWLIILAVAIQNFFALQYYFGLSVAERDALEALTEHPTSLLYCFVFLLTLALCVVRSTSPMARFLLILTTIPTVWVFVLSQRRAAFIALMAGFVVVAIVLWFRRRKAFMALVPLVLLVFVGYTAAFWNTTEGIGFGAVAVKSVIAPGDLSEKDESSDLYRQIENFDLVYTAKTDPFGVGFGKPFYQPIPLPDISFFVFSEYIPHNSIMWIWLKMGYLGFVTLLFVLAAAIRAGTRAVMRLPTGNTLAVTVTALAYIVMFVIFAYVDIAWSAQTCLVLAVCLALVSNVVRLSDGTRQDEDSSTGYEDFDQIAELSLR